MKALDRPSGYFETYDPVKGLKIEGETRSCVHCGFMWIYNPKESFDRLLAGKGVTRGTCVHCWGPVCCQATCLAQGCTPLMKKIEAVEEHYRKSPAGLLLGV